MTKKDEMETKPHGHDAARVDDLHADLDLLRQAAETAGDLALRFFRQEQKTWLKEGGSIVGEADIAVDRSLATFLRQARPGYGWLSEETVDTAERLDRERVFVIDPIDGTRGFVAGRDQWAVSLAVVERGRPVVAVLAVPALARTFHAICGHGAWSGDKRLRAADREDLRGARFASAKRYGRAAAEAAGVPFSGVLFIPSLAYRLALVASGEVDVAIAKANAQDWDLAAADLLVQEAGARLSDLAGRSLRYNRADTGHPALVASSAALFDSVADLVVRLDGEPARIERREGMGESFGQA